MTAAPHRARSALLWATLALVMAAPAGAEILLTQTGALRSSSGAGVDGEYSMIFSLYSSETSLVGLWSETHPAVEVGGGVFRVVLGTDEPLTTELLTDTEEVWLGVSVAGEPELPRLRLGRVAFSAVADYADTAGGLSGPIESLECSGCIDGADIADAAVGSDALAPGAVLAYHVAFAYAGSAVPGGAADLALDVECDGCVDPSDMAFPAATLAQVAELGPSLDDLGCEVGESPQKGETGWVCAKVQLAGLSDGKASGFELIDGLGYAWDGRERPPATFEKARDACLALGARLPNIGEVFRNSPSVVGGVGQSFQANWLWTMIERDKTNAMIGRWSNGQITVSAKTTPRHYRCVWPDDQGADFAGDRCLGGCFGFSGHWNLDSTDRPAMPLMAAVRECASVGGRVADLPEMESAIRAGLPNGSGLPVWTGDQYKGTNSGPAMIAVSWQGTKVGWFPPQKFGGANSYHGYWPDNATPRTRCIGIAAKGELTAPTAGDVTLEAEAMSADAADKVAFSYLEATDKCRDLGGHVVDNIEALALIASGWAGGSGAGIWTSEHHDLAMLTLYWTDEEPSFYPAKSFVASGSGFGTKWYSELSAHRCVYYSTTAWTEPADCKGGCFKTEAGGRHLALDKEDRTPATYFDAVDHCRSMGGRVAGTRDLEELVRLGAPNGGGVGVWTTSSHATANTGPAKLTVRWTGTNKGWNPVNDFTNGVVGYNSQWPGSPLPYRCVWTNEVH